MLKNTVFCDNLTTYIKDGELEENESKSHPSVLRYSATAEETMFKVICVAVVVCGLTEAIPKYETSKDNQWRRSSATSSYYNTLEKEKENANNTANAIQESASTKERIQRLGYTTGYGGISVNEVDNARNIKRKKNTFNLQGYQNSGTGLSSYSPIKLDIGGIVVGTLVGLGAVIIIPKLISVLHGGYGSGGYGRSENGDDLSTLSSLINRMDDVMAQNNIDSTSCMQKAVCTYVRSTENSLQLGSQDQIDQFVHSLSE